MEESPLSPNTSGGPDENRESNAFKRLWLRVLTLLSWMIRQNWKSTTPQNVSSWFCKWADLDYHRKSSLFWMISCNSTIFKTYLIFVLFFTRTKFLENKIYTEKTRKLRQNTQYFANFLRYYAKYTVNCQFFALNLKKIYTCQKNLHWRRRPRRRQLSGMVKISTFANGQGRGGWQIHVKAFTKCRQFWQLNIVFKRVNACSMNKHWHP